MNIVELHTAIRQERRWIKFAEKLQKEMTEEYKLDGITVVLRELTADEAAVEGRESLTFNQTSQQFEFALAASEDLPAPWKIADRIGGFLNPDPDETD